MSIQDGQRVRALESNTAWSSKTNDNDMLGVQTLDNPGSGPTVANLQQTVNDNLTDIQVLETDKENKSEKGVASGYASLDVGGKIPLSELPDSIVGAMQFKGFWNASTNTPSLADGDGSLPGDTFQATVAGTVDFGSGNIVFTVGDFVIYDGSIWGKLEGGQVESVNGFVGAVVLDTDDISEGASNFYWTEARFDTSLGTKDTDDLSEGLTNFYYTEARFDTSLGTKDTDDLAEGITNFYYTGARFDSSFSGKDTDDLSEGITNFYYTEARFNTSLGTKDTDDLAEGAANLYYTNSRADARISLAVLNDLLNVNVPAPTDGQVLTWDNPASEWQAKTAVGGASELDDLTDVDLTVAPTNGQVLSFDGVSSTWKAATASGGGANTNLSNLDSPTSINQNLIPTGSGTIALGNATNRFGNVFANDGRFSSLSPISDSGGSLGSTSLRWTQIFAASTIGCYTSATLRVGINPAGGRPTGGTAASLFHFQVDPIGVFTGNNFTANATPTGEVFLESGNKTVGTGDSGNITLTTGTSAGGNRGRVLVNSRTFRLPKHASAPTATESGEMYYDTTSNISYTWDGSVWQAHY